MTEFTDFVPTTRLRFAWREVALQRGPVIEIAAHRVKVLQQWFAPNVPGYMSDPAVGEWRDVPDAVVFFAPLDAEVEQV